MTNSLISLQASLPKAPKNQKAKTGGFLLTLQQKIKKLAGGAAGAGRRRKRRWRSQTQAPKAQKANFESPKASTA